MVVSESSIPLEEAITPRFLGVFWFVQELEIDQSRYFQKLNYFLDDLIQNNFIQNADKDFGPQSLFTGKSYGQQFFVGHFRWDQQFPYDAVDRQYEVIKSHIRPDRNKILCLGEQSSFGIKEFDRLRRRFNNLELVWFQPAKP